MVNTDVSCPWWIWGGRRGLAVARRLPGAWLEQILWPGVAEVLRQFNGVGLSFSRAGARAAGTYGYEHAALSLREAHCANEDDDADAW